jgi:tetratricopeptide (TPR) repeat protein
VGSFAGRYVLVDPIGAGGMGSVWRAWDSREGRYVAAKLLRAADAGSVLRFVREQSLRVAHPHVAAPLAWAAEDDQVLFTMDLVRGGDVGRLLGDYGSLPLTYAAVLVDQLLCALAAVHAQGIVHRDVKPSNLLLEPTGRGRPFLRLADFGIAAVLGEPRLTYHRHVVGSDGYRAPEAGPGVDPDPRQDLYAVGVVALQLLTGHLPAAGTQGAAEAGPELPAAVREIVGHLLAASPAGRPHSATAALRAWRAAVEPVAPWPAAHDGAAADPDDTDPDAIEVFDQIGPLPDGFGPDGPGEEDGPPPPAGLPSHAGPAPVRPTPAQLPGDVAAFTGRAGELAELDRLLTAPETGAEATALVISAVAGSGGVGKTALAVRWAHRVRTSFPDGQLYVDLRGYDAQQPVPPAEALTRFLNALGVTGQDVPLDADERAARYRTEVAGRRMLIVLDNASAVDQVRPLLPGTASCVVLVTSRDSLAGLVSLHGACRLDLDRLPPGDAVALLRRLAGSRGDAEPTAVAALAEQCARLPLALRVAAELVAARPATTVADLVDELSDQQRRLDLLDAGGDTRAAVRAVFSWSYDQLPPAAARAFRLLGLHPGPDLDDYAGAALTGVGLAEARRLLDSLARAHLTERTATGRTGMHDLLRAYAAELAARRDTEADRREALTRLLDYYLTTAVAATKVLTVQWSGAAPASPWAGPTPALTGRRAALAWLDGERLTLAAVGALAVGHGWPRHAIELSRALFRYHENGGHFTDMLAAQTHAAATARQIGDRAAEAHALTNLGVAHHFLSGYRPAAEHLERALALFRDLGDRFGEARTLINLGNVCRRLGIGGPAVAHIERALTLFRDLGDRAGQASALGTLGLVHWQLGHYELAADYQRQARELHREVGNTVGEARALDNLGLVHRHLGDPRSAAVHHRQALELFRRTSYRSGEAHALNNLGDAYIGLRSYARAAGFHQRAHALFREIGERYGEMGALNGLGEARSGAGRPGEAVEMHRAALAIAIDTDDRDELARAHAGLGRAYVGLGDVGRARRHWAEALTRYTELGSPLAEEVAANLNALPAQER